MADDSHSAGGTLFLTLETTCDETAAAVIDERLHVLGSSVASQDELHERFGGVVPELAARAHVERILPVIDEALRRAAVRAEQIGCVAVATRPGLAGSLLVGLAAAKALCVAWQVPLVAIDHLQAHLYACRLAYGEEVFPCVGLVASGGHTSLYHCRGPLDWQLLGGTIDDAAGESFDKVASMLGLPYPGGPAVEQVAKTGNAQAFRFPRSFIHDRQRLAFSFSGLKTAVRYAIAPAGVQPPEHLAPALVADLAASFQEAVVDVLVGKCLHALQTTGLRALAIGGGVAANARLAERFKQAAGQHDFRLYIAPRQLCTDNAVMGAIAVERWRAGLVETLDLDVTPGLVR
ncbi:MAG TPA: tRNA (adenosine(37)-N6)-threonylcarbamoyltransferase complex transferase subunit TsaD [Pirellulales bacterium]|nr:tRNA (adenosine(37)-N6)-threonylcarbamoyltransferase complex transferase subunit TsaD [Pirellulales bacterium]